MKRYLALILVLFGWFSQSIRAQSPVLAKAIQQLATLKNVSYTENRATKSFFSDEMSKEIIYAHISNQLIENNSLAVFDLTTNSNKVVFNGSSLLQLNTKEKTYTIDKTPDLSIYQRESTFGWLKLMQDFNANTPNKIKTLADTLINKIPCYHIKLIASDTVVKKERQYSIYDIYLNKDNYFPVRTKRSMRGTLAKGGNESDVVITYAQEQSFSDYKINDKGFPDLSEFKIPADYNHEKKEAEKPLLAIGNEAPEWSLVNTTGKLLSSKELKGKVLLIDFTLNACVPCILAIPTMNSLHQKYANTNVEVISINSYDKKEDILKFAKQNKINFPTYIDQKNLDQKFNVSGYPTFYIIDKNGKVAASFSGYDDKLQGQLIDKIEEINNH